MFNAGLVFSLEFAEDELDQPHWRLLDQKIMDGINALPGRLNLPLRLSNTPMSANDTLWTFVQCHKRAARRHCGHRLMYLVPPTEPITLSMYKLETLIQVLATPNPISCPDDTPIPENLIIIGMFSKHYPNIVPTFSF